ncbi:hypothetical protein [Nocardia arizonensis]|nr:hypothetical protein [Nocardia arizonensis]
MAVPAHLAGERSVPILARDQARMRTLFERAVNGYFSHTTLHRQP